MTKRAESEDKTRLRITESAVALHGSLGPSQTSMSAIAEHAGVPRSTVYRHFADEKALFAACTAHWMAANPLPGLGEWARIPDPDDRLRIALRQMYSFYARTEQMLRNVLRDQETMPIVKQMAGGYHGYLAEARETLMAGRKLKEPVRRRVRALIGHVLSFQVWRSLAVEQGLDGAVCADLMCLLVAAANSAKPHADRLK